MLDLNKEEAVYSLKNNSFYILDIFEYVPEDYARYKHKIYPIPWVYRERGIMIFSGLLRSIDLPEGTTREDVFVAFELEGMRLELKKVNPGDCVIIHDALRVVVSGSDVEKYFTDMNFFKMPIILS